jgi:hypothetical protein
LFRIDSKVTASSQLVKKVVIFSKDDNFGIAALKLPKVVDILKIK